MLDNGENGFQIGPQWDDRYAGSYGKLMERGCEQTRYRTIGEIVSALPVRSSLLDVGCGIATMVDYLPALDYTGVDVSQKALSVARSRHSGTFVCSAAEDFHTEEKFDVILFNESLYYFENPMEQLTRYRGFLSEGGSIIVSIWLPAPEHPSNASHMGLVSAIIFSAVLSRYPVQTRDVEDELRWRIVSIGMPGYARSWSPPARTGLHERRAGVEAMHAFAAAQGYAPDFSDTRRHREIYLSDPRKAELAKLRTVVRHPARPA